MSDRPEITLQQVRARASEQSFSRGENYYNTGAVSDTVRRGDEIEARCHGSYPEPYRVWIRVDASGIAATRCNCEYDWGGDCKHIVAVLLTYLHQPHKFEARQTLQAALLNRSKEDMVDIIMMMVNRYPDLQDIVDSPTPNEIVTGMVPLDTLSFRQELRNAFNEYDYDGYYEYGDSASGKAMNRVASVADRLAERGDWLNAAAVYRTVLEEFAEMDEGLFNLHDDSVFSSLYDITSSLEQCLTQPVVKDHDDECHAILQAILGIFIWDTKIGGYGLSDDTPEIILKHVRREDIPAIRRRVEEARDRRIKGSYGDWSAEVYNSFLTDLDMLAEVEPEIILERLRAQEMYHLLVNKLLEMNRVNEAVMVIQQNINSAYAWIQALNLLVEHNENAKARQVAEDILAGEYDYELAEWLLDRYKAENNKTELLRWQKRQMVERPNVNDYGELKATAQSLGQWDEMRPQIIRDMEICKDYDVLTRVYLHDGEYVLAWETLPKAKRENYYGRSLELEVAVASRHALPERAIPVFVRYARQYIDSRGRDNYQQAASLLAKVQQAYDQLGEIETWETLIAELREEHKRLPALKDELNKAGL